MTHASSITFVSHTNKPGGGELALRRYLEATDLPVRLVTLEVGGVWEGLEREVVHAHSLRGLRRALCDGGLVVANSMRAAFLAVLVSPRRTQLVYWVRDGLTDSAMSPLALRLTKHVTARRVRHYIANSQWTAGTIREALGVVADQVDVVYSMCGISEEMLDRPPRTEPHTPLRLLFLGRLSPWKAPDVAVRALAPLRELGIEATLTIAGAAHFGEERYVNELRSLVASEPTATMVGHVDDVPALLASHDILVHCSTLPEPFGQVVVQAMAAGMPVVATDHGGPVELLNSAHQEGLYEHGDSIQLASRVQQAFVAYTEFSRYGLRRASDFSDETSRRLADMMFSALLTSGAAGRSPSSS